jgi:putative ABC transport system permease protein
MRAPGRPPGRRFRFPWRTPGEVAADIDEELSFHLDRVAEDLIAAGWSPETARQEALRQFGDLEGTRHYCRDLATRKERQMKWSDQLETFFQDLRFAVRQLARHPAFTLIAILTLALGTGAVTAIFSVVHTVLLSPLPYREPDRLVQMLSVYEGETDPSSSAPNIVDWQEMGRTQRLFAGSSIVDTKTFNLTGKEGEPERLSGQKVEAGFFSALGVRPLLGRGFAAGEDQANAAGTDHVAVLSEGLWRRRFGADPGILRQTIQLNGEPYTVVGVMPDGIQFPADLEIWTPRIYSENDKQNRGAYQYESIARLAPGVSFEQARAATEALGKHLAEAYPDANAGYGLTLVPLTEFRVGDVRTPLLILLGAVAVVLLIACANVANLLLVRSAGREGEIAVRSAVGAGQWRIARQLVTESVLLSLLGGAAGLLLAFWAVRLLAAHGPEGIPRLQEVRLDGPVLAFTLFMTLLTGVLFGLAPALQASRPDLNRVLKEGGRGALGSPGSRRARHALVILETALAVLLLTAAGLLIRSFAELQRVDLGFRPEGVATFNVSLPRNQYPDDPPVRAFVANLVERLRTVPGVRSAAAGFGLPLSSSGNAYISFTIEGKPPWPPGQDETLLVRLVTPDYLSTLGIPLLQGRGFSPRDRDGSQPVLLVNQAAVRRFFPEESPLGQRLNIGWGKDDKMLGGEIVGVVGDVHQVGLDHEVVPEVYAPFDQWPIGSVSVVLRTAGDPETALAQARSEVRALAPDLPVYNGRTLDDVVAQSVAQPRFYMVLLGTFAALALVLAAIGIYGVISYLVNQRTQEIGIRIALGATRERVLGMVVGQGIGMALAGAALGVAGALALTRGMSSLLYGVSATDPATFAGVAAVLVLVAVMASYLPARRAARIEPQLALRGEG